MKKNEKNTPSDEEVLFKGKGHYKVFRDGSLDMKFYNETNNSRYTNIKSIGRGGVYTTQEDYRVVLYYPRKNNLMDTVKQLREDTETVARFLTECYMKGGTEA